MRQDKVIFSGPNPFVEFAQCKELTVLLGEDRFMFVATINSTHIMTNFKSLVRTLEGTKGTYKEAYSIPLSLVMPLFKLDSGTTDNVLTLETTADKVTITYNKFSVETDIFSPNGLTMMQVGSLNVSKSIEVLPTPFIQISDLFGTSKDNFCNVDGNTLFISDSNKCIIHKGETDFGKKFSIPLSFVRLMKSMECVKLFIGENIIAETKSGLWVFTSLSKITDPNVLMDFKFAARLKSDDVYTLSLNKYLKHISVAVQNKDISASLNFNDRDLILSSVSGEKTVIKLDESAIEREGEFDFFADLDKAKKSIILRDARLIRSLATFTKVKVKVCPTFVIAKLGKEHHLLFQLRGEAS